MTPDTAPNSATLLATFREAIADVRHQTQATRATNDRPAIGHVIPVDRPSERAKTAVSATRKLTPSSSTDAVRFMASPGAFGDADPYPHGE